jgi:CheY-like chemotaxis protein
MSDFGGPRFVVLNDAPVGDGNEGDLLDATQVARGLADLIVASRDAAPFTLAIDAAWGMGKSSMMRRLESTLADEAGVSVVWFNAWTSGQASALEGLIKSVLLRFDRNIIRRAVRSMTQRAHLLGLVRATVLVAGSFFGLGKVVDEIWQRLALDAQSRNQIKGVMKDAFHAWIERGGNGGNRRLLAVFIDDLDRCPSERIIEVCEAIKLYLDVPGVVFVLACDQSALWRAVRDSAGIGEAADAVEYLEKILQINYRIPVPSPARALHLVDGYLAMSGTSQLFDESMKGMIIERSGRNPRRIKRLINSFVLEYHLNRAWSEIGLENLVKVIMLQHFYPGFYRVLTDPRDEDPMSDFLAYQRLRVTIKQGDAEATGWHSLFIKKGIRPPKDETPPERWVDYLAELEHELPAEFPTLATDRDFVALIESFDHSLGSEQLRRLLRRSPLTSIAPPDYSMVLEAQSEQRRMLTPPRNESILNARLAGLRILWIDDNPASNTRLLEYLVRHGAVVVTATDRKSALSEITLAKPDVVLSDFTRDGDVNAGLDDLEYLRQQGVYDGPVIFCSGQGTPHRQQRAGELGALGPTNDENQMIAWLSAIGTTKRT